MATGPSGHHPDHGIKATVIWIVDAAKANVESIFTDDDVAIGGKEQRVAGCAEASITKLCQLTIRALEAATFSEQIEGVEINRNDEHLTCFDIKFGLVSRIAMIFLQGIGSALGQRMLRRSPLLRLIIEGEKVELCGERPASDQ